LSFFALRRMPMQAPLLGNLRKDGGLAIIMKQAYQFACGHNVVKLK
jgi:hypothetical protein